MESSQIETRLASIEARLSKIESNLKIQTPPLASDREFDPWQQPRPTTKSYKAPAPSEKLDERPGNWLGIIAIVCFVLAAAFIIKLSIESGWLTPVRQIGLAGLLGISLIGTGLALMKSDRTYASLLPGGGIIVLYLTGFAAHRMYSLITFETAIATTALVSALCVWLYIKIRHDVYPITATVGAYIAPVVLWTGLEPAFSIYYYIVCSVTFATISIWVGSRTLTLISSYLAIVMTSVIGMDLHDNVLVASALALNFVIFATGNTLYSVKTTKPLDETEAWCFLPILLIFYAAEYHFIDHIQPGLAPWLSMGFAGILTVLYLLARAYGMHGQGSQSLVLAFASLVGFHSVYLELMPDDMRPWLFVVIVLITALFPSKLTTRDPNSPYALPALALFAIVVIEYFTIAFNVLRYGYSSWMWVSLAAIASIWVLNLRSDNQSKSGDTTSGYALLGSAHILAILSLYRLGTDHGSLAVSAAWLCYAVGVILFSFIRKDEVMAKSALFVLAFAAGKALLYDAASAPTVIRIVCLLLTGAVLYGCGFFMRKVSEWKHD